MKKYVPTIGIECHVQLSTKTKLFSSVGNDARDREPNSCVSPVDYALPGMLPVLNERAVEYAVRAGLALNSEINLISRFDRKHYYYPDLPKGYQISQFYQPIIGAGYVELPDGARVRIEHAHLEEDAGKLTHHGEYSLVDLNRAGTPLIEVVSMPDIHSAKHAQDYCKELWRLMTYSNVCNGDLYHGNMRFDVNISVAEEGSKELGVRVEIKNLNSFRSVERAAEYEYKRQVEMLEKGEKITQETRGWSDAKGKTTSQRSKERAQDYRYMPEPDVPPVVLSNEYVDNVRMAMPLLPKDYRKQLIFNGVDAAIVEVLLDYQKLVAILVQIKDKSLVKKVANLFASVLLAEENIGLINGSIPLAENIEELVLMNDKNELSSTSTKAVFIEMFAHPEKSPRALAGELNLVQENDTGALEKIIDEVLSMPVAQQAVEDFKNGEEKALGFLVGQAMKLSRGKANPVVITEILQNKLKK
jgi:aspartyl-tRNA(Asn)/glutamyl-tRNA(Gln) amidotransferase subunit B